MENSLTMQRQEENKTKNAYVFFVLFFYLFLARDWLEVHWSIFGYIDDLLAVLAIPLWLMNLYANKFVIRLRRGGYGIYLMLFTLCGVLGTLVYHYQPLIQCALPDLFLCLKFWLAIYTGRYVFQYLRVDLYAKKIFFHIRIVTWIFTILIILDNIFFLFPESIRYGLRSTQLFYTHPTVFVSLCLLMVVILISIKDYINGSTKYLIWLCLLICTTLRSKAFGAVMAIVLIYYFTIIRKKKIKLRTFLMFIPLVIAVAWEQIEFYFLSSVQFDSARYQLLVKAVYIAFDHFPFGAGFGTYASYFSAIFYSPLYNLYRISNVYGLREGAAFFVNDSFWPTILGETGWIGMLFYLLVLWALFKQIQKIKEYNLAFYMSALCILAYEMIASAAESAFFHPLAISLAMWLGFLMQAADRNVKMIGDEYNSK
ncbi:MAG: hypothetical protein LBS36_06770 [Oscillospiraceae bacterium]|jgi:hypothetical protein|nr:hypothetical protein [Oscillospiraceae bacterium]